MNIAIKLNEPEVAAETLVEEKNLASVSVSTEKPHVFVSLGKHEIAFEPLHPVPELVKFKIVGPLVKVDSEIRADSELYYVNLPVVRFDEFALRAIPPSELKAKQATEAKTAKAGDLALSA